MKQYVFLWLFLELIQVFVLIGFLDNDILFRIRCHSGLKLDFLELTKDSVLIYHILIVSFDVLIGMGLILMVVPLRELNFLLWGGFLLLVDFDDIRSVHFVHNFIVFAKRWGWQIRVKLFFTIIYWEIAHIFSRWGHRMVKVKRKHIKWRRKTYLVFLNGLRRDFLLCLS